MKKQTTKLSINRETLRKLGRDEMDRVAGGVLEPIYVQGVAMILIGGQYRPLGSKISGGSLPGQSL